MRSFMKTIFKHVTAAVLAVVLGQGVVWAQGGPPKVGFVRLVNAIAPGTGKANFLIDGGDIFPSGYKLGQRTGGMGLREGSHTITMRKEGVAEGTTKIRLGEGETMSFIGFAEKVPAEKEGDPPTWRMRILKLKQSSPEKGYRMTLVSVCHEDHLMVQAKLEGKEKPEVVYAKKMTTTSLDLGQARGEVLVKVGGDLVSTIAPDEPGNYVVVLFDDEDGKVRAISFYDPKFVIAG